MHLGEGAWSRLKVGCVYKLILFLELGTISSLLQFIPLTLAQECTQVPIHIDFIVIAHWDKQKEVSELNGICLLYTSDAADE